MERIVAHPSCRSLVPLDRSRLLPLHAPPSALQTAVDLFPRQPESAATSRHGGRRRRSAPAATRRCCRPPARGARADRRSLPRRAFVDPPLPRRAVRLRRASCRCRHRPDFTAHSKEERAMKDLALTAASAAAAATRAVRRRACGAGRAVRHQLPGPRRLRPADPIRAAICGSTACMCPRATPGRHRSRWCIDLHGHALTNDDQMKRFGTSRAVGSSGLHRRLAAGDRQQLERAGLLHRRLRPARSTMSASCAR